MQKTYNLSNQYAHGDDLEIYREQNLSTAEWMEKVNMGLIDSNNPEDLLKRKQIISNFIQIITENPNIQVQYATVNSLYASDGRATFDNNGRPAILINPVTHEQDFDVVTGLALHEASHIKETDYSVRTTFDQKLDARDKELTFYLENWIEDRRIDGLMKSKFPGYKGYYGALYRRYFTDPTLADELNNLSDPTIKNYFAQIIGGLLNPKFKSKLPRFNEILDILSPQNIAVLQNTTDSMLLAIETFRKIKEIVNEPESTKTEDSQTDSGEDNRSDDSKPQNSDNSKSKKNADQNINGPKNDSEKSEADSEPAENSDTSDGKDDSTEESGNENDTNGDQTGTEESAIDSKELDDAKQKAADRRNGKFETEDRPNSEFSPNLEFPKELSTSAVEQLNKVVKFLDSKEITSVDSDTNDAIQILESIEIKDDKTTRFRFISIPNQSLNLFLSKSTLPGEFSLMDAKTVVGRRKITDAIKKGTALAAKLKIQSETRDLKTINLKQGRLNKRALFKGEFNESIFQNLSVSIPSNKLIHIDVDGSSSMNGQKWINAISLSISIAKACSLIKNLDCEIWIRYSHTVLNLGGRSSGLHSLILEVYNSKKGHTLETNRLRFFSILYPTGSTPEGEAYRAAHNLGILPISTPKSQAYFITISDGEPNYPHVVTEMVPIIKRRLPVKAYFVGNTPYESKFEASKDYYYRKIVKFWGEANCAYCDMNNMTQIATDITNLLRK